MLLLLPQVSLAQHVPNNDIFVLTPQILVDALTANEAQIEMSTFSLLIFDECHHADKGHPYNKVMALYLDKKLEPGSILPQVQFIVDTCLLAIHTNYIISHCTTLQANMIILANCG